MRGILFAVVAVAVLSAFVAGQSDAAETASDGSVYWYETYGVAHPDYYCVITDAESEADVLHVPAVLEGYDVRSISSGAFDGCDAKTIVIPGGVQTICEGAFTGCGRLEDAYFLGDRPEMDGAFSEGVAFHSFEDADGWEGSETIAVAESGGVKYAMLPDGAIAIGGTPVDGVLRIASQVAGTRVVSIGPYAFAGSMRADGEVDRRSDISEAVLPESLLKIGQRAFYYSDLERISVPGSLEAVEDEAFRACYALEGFDLPVSVSYIGFEAFRDCRSLEEVTVPAGASIGDGAFYICSSLKSAEVSSVPDRAFGYCSSLESVHIGSAAESVGNMAFYRCYSLKEAKIPDSVVSVGKEAFFDCSSLDVLCLGSVETIGKAAFRGCISLSEVAVPASVTALGGYAFADCVSLKDVIAEGACPEGDDTVFLNDPATVTCSEEHVSSWKDSAFGLPVKSDRPAGLEPALILACVLAVLVAVAVLVAIIRRRRGRKSRLFPSVFIIFKNSPPRTHSLYYAF